MKDCRKGEKGALDVKPENQDLAASDQDKKKDVAHYMYINMQAGGRCKICLY